MFALFSLPFYLGNEIASIKYIYIYIFFFPIFPGKKISILPLFILGFKRFIEKGAIFLIELALKFG